MISDDPGFKILKLYSITDQQIPLSDLCHYLALLHLFQLNDLVKGIYYYYLSIIFRWFSLITIKNSSSTTINPNQKLMVDQIQKTNQTTTTSDQWVIIWCLFQQYQQLGGYQLRPELTNHLGYQLLDYQPVATRVTPVKTSNEVS